MKLKNTFAGFLAVSMMASMAVPAFATSPSFSNDPITGPLELTKIYDVLKGTAPAEDLQFKVTYWKSEKVVNGGIDNNIPTDSLIYNADFTEGGTEDGLALGQHKKTFSIDLQHDLGINKVGKYYFKVQEIPGDMASVSYDSDVRILVVSAVNKVDDDGKLLGGLDYYAALYEMGSGGELGGKVSGGEAFENKYGKDDCDHDNVFNIDLSKEVRGRFADRDEEFTFNIVFTPGAGKNADDYYGATIVWNGQSDVWEIDGTTEHHVTLKHGDTFTIENLPKGVTYTVTEDFSDADWSTTADGEDGTTTTGTITADKDIDYVNKHNGVPDTGVILDNAPYFVLLSVVMAGSTVLFIQKRRRTEE